MELTPEVQKVAALLKCDPNDPVFAILGEIYQIRDQLGIPQLGALRETLQSVELKLGATRTEFEKMGVEMSQTLVAAHQVRTRGLILSALVGMALATTSLGGLSLYDHFTSSERLLRGSRLKLNVQRSEGKTLVTIQGPNLLHAAKGNDRITAEFSE